MEPSPTRSRSAESRSTKPGSTELGSTKSTGTSMTPEQSEVARLLCLGLTKRAIGLQLKLSPAGVDARLRRAYRATGAQCQIELGGWCVAHGVVSVEELQKAYGTNGEVGSGTKR